MKAKVSVLIGGLVFAVAGAAFAGHHEGKGGERKAKMEASIAERFAKMDADASGAVSREEYLAYKAAEAEKSWAALAEGDEDGALTLAEIKARKAEKRASKDITMKGKKIKEN